MVNKYLGKNMLGKINNSAMRIKNSTPTIKAWVNKIGAKEEG